ncbi:MAG TPA: nucleoside-diphosphate sugar epimerase/dehydratase [Candidatus Methylomirabilis sp.]|nr:nucleoside-diphosphate sugar epimerase/dehydratase [Candidatus Methylomirabilis sp.]
MSTHMLQPPLRVFCGHAGRALDRLPRWIFNRWGLIAIDGSLSMVALWLAWQLRFDFNVPSNYQAAVRASAVALALIRPSCLWILGAYRAVWRYFNLGDAMTLCLAALPPTVIMLLLRIGWLQYHPAAVLPLTVIVVDYGVFLMLAGGARILRRYLFEASLGGSTPKRTLLIGTGEGLASALRQISFYSEIRVVCVLSPDKKLHGARLAGFTVSDGPESLSKHLTSEMVDLVLIADADVETIGDSIATAVEFGIEARLLPLATHIINGEVRISRNAKPELAIKKAVPVATLPDPAVVEAFRGSCVLITGAGGSIGSELSRQVSHLSVERLILLDQDENSIFRMHGELSSSLRGQTQLVPLVADVRDRDRMVAIFDKYGPDVVLHAAAYKHVPVMEHNCSEAVLNNVLGTYTVAEAAIHCGSERLLMVSTDKAVNPSSIMGATKRMAELTVQHLARQQSEQQHATRCACVRFGNVMGSNGSVTPIFLRQIASGGPVTVTHEEMTRYFMTIPEAVQLVLQATTLAADGEIYVLDMGDPVKITTLAKRLIEMSGLRPGQDIEIRFVGTRPGEKLAEQLWNDSARVNRTGFPSILRVEPSPPPPDFREHLGTLLETAMKRNDECTRKVIMEMPMISDVCMPAATA